MDMTLIVAAFVVPFILVLGLVGIVAYFIHYAQKVIFLTFDNFLTHG